MIDSMCMLVSGLVFLFGLLAPLTPSVGAPLASDLLLFLAAPVLLLVWVVVTSENQQNRQLALSICVQIALLVFFDIAVKLLEAFVESGRSSV